MANQLEVRIGEQVRNVGSATGEEVIEADDLVSFIEKAFTKMGAKEAGAAGDKNSHEFLLCGNYRASICKGLPFIISCRLQMDSILRKGIKEYSFWCYNWINIDT